MDTRFVGDRILLAIHDGEGRDLSSGYSGFNIVVVRAADNTVTDTISATAGGNGNSTVTADRNTTAAAFTEGGVHTYHVAATETGGDTHTIGVGYLDIMEVPGA